MADKKDTAKIEIIPCDQGHYGNSYCSACNHRLEDPTPSICPGCGRKLVGTTVTIYPGGSDF